MAFEFRAAALPFLIATLGACGGGGGGGGVSAPTEVPLTSFSAVQPNQALVMEGNAAAVSVTVSGTTATSADSGPIGTATVTFAHDANRQLSGVSVNTAEANFSIDRSAGHEWTCRGRLCLGESATALALVADPAANGWSYQSFGIWATESSATSGKLGALSAGNPTSGSSLPLTGTFTFRGLAIGFHIDGGGSLQGTAALMSADVNFGTRNILFSTSETRRGPSAETASIRDDSLNLSGTFTYQPGVNAFSGPVQAQNGLSGQGAGRFFGPGAEEIGGVYSLQGSGLRRMVGGFGGKRGN
jgi:hypothetical protein